MVFEGRDFGALEGGRWQSSPLPDPQPVFPWAGEGRQETLQPQTGIVTPPHQGPGLRAFQKPSLAALLGLPKETLQLWKRKSKEKKNILKVNWITATASLRERLMGPLINESGSQWDIAFALMPCTVQRLSVMNTQNVLHQALVL